VPPTRRPRVHHRVSPYPGARKQKKISLFVAAQKINDFLCSYGIVSLCIVVEIHKYVIIFDRTGKNGGKLVS